MDLDEEIYVNIEELSDKTKPHGQKETETVAGSETTHFKVVIFCLGLLSFALLITAIGVGAQYTTDYHQLLGFLMNRTSETEQLLIRNRNLTVERDQINSSYQSVLLELHKVKESTGSCPFGWRKFGCSCYLLSTTSNTWEDSKQQCIYKGANLVTISTQKEMMFLNGIGANFWIGLSTQNGYWQWTDGRSATTTYWQAGYPYYFGHHYQFGNNKICAVFNTFNTGFFQFSIKSWTSEDCNYRRQWVCEKETEIAVLS